MFGITSESFTPANMLANYKSALQSTSRVTVPIAVVRINNARGTGRIMKAAAVSAADVALCGAVTGVQLISWAFTTSKRAVLAKKAEIDAAKLATMTTLSTDAPNNGPDNVHEIKPPTPKKNDKRDQDEPHEENA